MIGNTVPTVTDESGRTTLRVRNIRESVVYHLMFDGDVRRLTGTQLKDHVASVCGIPAAQQILTFNNYQVTSETSGFDLGLHDGCTLLLDTVSRGPPRRSQSNASTSGAAAQPGALGGAGTSSESAASRGTGVESATNSQQRPRAVAAPVRSKFEEELEAVRRDERRGDTGATPYAGGGGSRGNSNNNNNGYAAHLNSSEHLSHHQQQQSSTPFYENDLKRRYTSNNNNSIIAAPHSAALTTAPYDDIDVDVEIEEEHGVPLWAPSNSVDLEESRLLQQDYTWRMEQVRFETERMNREREMLRQKQELDYQSELLERERIELEEKLPQG